MTEWAVNPTASSRPVAVANDVVRTAVRADPSDRLPFACECGCGRSGCGERVWLTLAEFDRRRERCEPVQA